MKKLKLALCAVLVLALIGCAGIGLKLSDNAITVLQSSATSTVGYYIAKNNPEKMRQVLTWHATFKALNELSSIQEMWKDGMLDLQEMVKADPFVKLKLKEAMSLLEISADGPVSEINIGKYQAVVDSFMAGVMAFNL